MKRFLIVLLLVLLPAFAQAETCQTFVATGYASVVFGSWSSSPTGQNPELPYWLPMTAINDPFYGCPDGNQRWYDINRGDGGNYEWYTSSGYCTGYYRTDSDCDGVEDAIDQCPETAEDDWNFDATIPSTPDGCPVPPLEPASCLDGVLSGSETGIDCGDPACVGDETCTTYCPAGFNSETRQGLEYCYSADDTPDYTIDAKLGICPANYFKSNTDETKCVSSALPTWADSDYLDEVTTDDADATPWNNVFTEETTNITSSTDTVDGVTTEVETTTTTGSGDTGEAAEDVTTVTTVTQADGSKVETTVKESSLLDASGVLAGTTTTTTKTYDSGGSLTGQTTDTENIGSEPGAGAAFSSPGEGDAYAVDGEKGGQFATRFTEFQESVTDAPIYSTFDSLFDGPDTSGKTSVFSLSMGSYGSQSLDLADYDSAFSVLGQLFIFLSLLAAGRLVMINKGQ